jgi:hypothetical protein
MHDIALPTTFVKPAVGGEAEHVFAIHARMWPGEWSARRSTLTMGEWSAPRSTLTLAA